MGGGRGGWHTSTVYSGGTIRDVKLPRQAHGTLNESRDNMIV